jgi:ribosomal protein L11 methyltransferase
MKNTIQVTIEIDNESVREELIAQLSTIQFDAFEEKEAQLEAFIPEEQFDNERLAEMLLPYNVIYKNNVIREQNWNAIWESSFQPVVVENFCAIRAHFHKPIPNILYEIIITPKMSFGTGHHATTYLMISKMREIDFKNKQVADFGTGTGVLAILGDKLGSNYVWAIDNDEWSINNAKENAENNSSRNIKIERAESFSPAQKFDVILANINKHVILNNIDGLLFGLNLKGKLLLSGLLKDDEQDIVSELDGKGLRHTSTVERSNWICLLFQHN